MTEAPWLIVGLGNPGPDYAGTRHNAGAMVIAELSHRIGARMKPVKGRRAEAGDGRLAGERVVIAVPSSYMNESGGPVASMRAYLKVPLEQIIVLHDELDVPFGETRVKRGGGAGGHNGIRDIDKALDSKEYLRVRVGVGRPPGRQDAADFVLKAFSAAERKELPFLLSRAADAVEALLSKPLELVQQEFNAPL